MPQLDFISFFSQIFWLCLVFVFFYLFVFKNLVPFVSHRTTVLVNKVNIARGISPVVIVAPTQESNKDCPGDEDTYEYTYTYEYGISSFCVEQIVKGLPALIDELLALAAKRRT